MFPKWIAVITAVVACAALSGWIFSISLLKSVLPGLVQMKANTAIGLFAASISLFILSNQPSARQRDVARLLAILIATLGLVTLCEYAFGWQLGIDELLFGDASVAFNAIRGRMSPMSAVIFVAIGVALFCLAWRSVVLLVATLIVTSNAIIFIGYLWNANELVTDSVLPPVAINSALAFCLIGIGIFHLGWTLNQGQTIDSVAAKKVLIGFVVAFGFLIFSGNFAYRASVEYARSVGMINHALQARIQLAKLEHGVSDINFSLANYLLTHQSDYKTQSLRFIAQLESDKVKVSELFSGDAGQLANTTKLWSQLTDQENHARQQLTIIEQQSETQAKAAFLSLENIRTSIHDTVTNMSERAKSELDSRGASVERRRLATLIGLIMTLLIAIGIFVKLFVEINVEMASNSKTRMQLQVTATRIETILNTVADGIITIDSAGKIDSFNHSAERLFGYSAVEVIGRNVNSLMPAPTSDQQDYFINNTFMSAEKSEAGIGREVVALRKDGSTFEMSLAVNEMVLAGQRFFTGVVSDITMRKKIETSLIDSKEQAELANHAKDSFLATMSHEIRTPLTGMLGMMELLSMSRLDTEQTNTLNAAWNSAKGLLRIVNDILDWSKIEAGELKLELHQVSVPHLLQDVVNTYSRVASAKKLVLSQSADPALRDFHLVDPLRLSQVLNNFVSNAIKFTDKGTVELRAELLEQAGDNDRVRFSVIDSGIGIAKEVQETLFERYKQGGVDTARLYGGTGLGLAICRRLAELMDGQVDLQSQTGKGSTFSIALTLPICSAPVRPLQSRKMADDLMAINFLADDQGTMPAILAVDDHPINRNLLASQLKIVGLRVDTAENGQVALDKWKNGDFSLIITDCHMPLMDGYTLARAIRRDETKHNRKPIPVIAWTANVLDDEIDYCLSAGMNEILVKPANLEQLTCLLSKYLAFSFIEYVATNSAGQISSHQSELPIDFTILNQIVTDKSAHNDTLRSFYKHIFIDYKKLIYALSSHDYAAVCSTAHRMKGSCRIVGASALASGLVDLEIATEIREQNRMDSAKQKIEEAFAMLDAYLVEIGVISNRKEDDYEH